ncbi:hypothetical protein ABPG73_002450 [Tetrahymena malaccensis]
MKVNIMQAYLLFILWIIESYSKPCQSQNIYGKVCHSSYVKKFIVDKELNQTYSISDDQLIITWDIQTGQYIDSFQGHRSFLIDIEQDQKGNIYSISSLGDIIVQNKYINTITSIFNCSNGGLIQNITMIDSTFTYFLYYDYSQTKTSIYDLNQQQQVLSLVFSQQQLVQVIENLQSDFIFFFDDGKYVEANLKNRQIQSFQLTSSIGSIKSVVQISNSSLDIYLITQQLQIFYIQYQSFGSMEVSSIQIPNINISSQIFLLTQENTYFLLTNSNQILWGNLNQLEIQNQSQVIQLTDFEYINQLTLFQIIKLNTNQYVASTNYGYLIQLNTSKNQLTVVNTNRYYPFQQISLIDFNNNQLLFFSLQGQYEGIEALYTSNWEICIEIRCFQLPWNLNVDQSSLIFNNDEDQLVLTHVGGYSLQDLTSNQQINQMKIFQQRLVLQYQSIVDYNLGIVVFLDNDFVNIVNYYTFEVIKLVQFISNSSLVKADIKYNPNNFEFYLTSSGNSMLQFMIINLKTITVNQYTTQLNLQPSCMSQEFLIQKNLITCTTFQDITNYFIDVQQNKLSVKASLNIDFYLSMKVSDQDVLLLLNSLGYVDKILMYNSTTLALINNLFYSIKGISSINLISQQKLILISINQKPTIILDINEQINLQTFQSQIYYFTENNLIICYVYDSSSQLIFFGYLQGTIIFGSYKDLSTYTVIKTSLSLVQIYFNAPSQILYAQQQVTNSQPYEITTLKINQEKEFDYQYKMQSLMYQQFTLSASFNLIIQIVQNQIIFYDLRNGQRLAKFDDNKIFTWYVNSFFLSSILNDNKLCVLTQFHFCLYSFKYPKRLEQQISIKREICIDSPQDGFDISSSIDSKFQNALIIDEINAYIFDLNTLKKVNTLNKNCCLFGYSYSIKHGIYFGGQNMNNFPIQLQFISTQQNKVLNFILVDITLFQRIIQLNQDFTCYTDTQGWVWFYSFQTQSLVRSKRFHATITTTLIYFELSFEIFAISLNKIYFGILNLYSGIDIQNYIITSQSSGISDIIVVDNLDLIIANGNNQYIEFYQKSTGYLIQTMNKYQIFYIQSFQSLIYQENYFGTYKLFDLNSLFTMLEFSVDKNQNVIPKLYDEKNQMIYAISHLNQIYQIDIQNQQMNNLVKRQNTILSIQQLGSYYIYQTSQEIIFQSMNYLNQENHIIQIASHQLEIIQLSQSQDIIQYFKLIIVTFPQSICFIKGSFDNKKLEYAEKQCSSQLQYKISSTKQINEDIILILHTNGVMSVINYNINSSGIFEVLLQQQCHNKKYQIQLLQNYQFSNSTKEIYYFFTYSIDFTMKLFQLIANKENNKYQLNQIYFQQFDNKILHLLITKDQNYAIISFQNQRFIKKICIYCLINNTTLFYQSFYQLPFSRSKFQVHLYEQYNYLLAFSSQMYLIFDFVMAQPLFISTQSYINDTISDIRVVSLNSIVIATQNNVQLLSIDFQQYKYNFIGATNQLFIQQNQNLKIFFTNLQTDNLDTSYYVFNLIGYDMGLNNVVFYKIPIISSNSIYTCIEYFKNPNQIIIQKKIDGYQQLQNSLTNQIKNYQFQLEFTQNLLNQDKSYISTAYPITIPHQSNNLSQKLLFTGSQIYLDKIDFLSMQSYYTVIYFNNATIYVKDNVIISSFTQVVFKNCTFYFLVPDISYQPYNISLNKNSYIEFTNITISNQSIPLNFQGFTISQNFDNLIIENLFLRNLRLQSFNPIFAISQGNNLTISQILFLKNTIQSDFSSLIFYLDRINFININNLKIENNQKQLISKQIALNYFIYVTTSKLQQISNIKFKSNQNYLFYYFPNLQKYQQDDVNYQIFFTVSSLIFQDIIYLNNTYDEQNQNPSILFQQIQSISMSNLFIKNNTIKNSVIIQIDSIKNVTLFNSFFSQNKIQSCILASSGDQIVLKNVNFTNNRSYGSGTGLALYNFTLTGQNLIQRCFFQENFSQDEGGAILMQNVDIDIQNSSFINNTSTIGGAIRYKQIIPSFVRNLKNKRSLQLQKSIIFIGNHAKIFGQNIGSYPQKVVLKDDLKRDLESYTFENYRSGDSTYSLKLVILDEEQNPVNTSYKDNSYSLKIQNEIKTYQLQLISLNLTELEIKDSTTFQYVRHGQDYLFNLQGMQLIGIPSKKVEFQIQTFFISTISQNQISIGQKVYSVFVSFRNCEIGEIYTKISDTIYECSPCGDKFYSLQTPTKDSNLACKSCPTEGAINCKDNKITVQQGYWRKNIYSDIIIYCDNRPQNCQGKESNGYCIEGFIAFNLFLIKIIIKDLVVKFAIAMVLFGEQNMGLQVTINAINVISRYIQLQNN